MIRRLVLYSSLATIFVLPASLFAWGDRGHEITGVIAYARLTAPVKKQINAMLAGDRDTLTPGDFVSRTTWADEYRDSDRLTTKKRYENTRNWHFVNIDIATGRIASACNRNLPPGIAASAGPAKACIIDKIEQFAAELRDKSSAENEKLLALKFLLHLVGDLHHPLHTADNRDRGGNDVPVVFGQRARRESLHSYWDNYLVQRLGSNARAVGASLDRQITRTKADAWAKGTPADWAKDSFNQAKAGAYDFTGQQKLSGAQGGGVRLNATYEQRAIPIVRDQLSKAGVRLASVLNDALR
jgi:hypothetical protein